MSEHAVFVWVLRGWYVLAAAVFVSLFFTAAPYGRHFRRNGWGPSLGTRTGWLFMEAPAPLVFAVCAWLGRRQAGIAGVAFLLLWEAHYIHRAFVYPSMLRERRRRMPLAVAAMGFVFNTVNGILNGRCLYGLCDGRSAAWLADPRFLCGAALFVAGFAVNRQSDRILLALRRPGETEYRIPRGGLFRWVSCPNYLGEIVEWFGWALATWSPAGLAFAVWTAANLIPRARSNHRWCRAQFPDYPPERKALLPGIW